MYAAHNKDINRHKSFHPLTFQNLSKVEQRLEEEEERRKEAENRSVTLAKEHHERRYDALKLLSTHGVRGDAVRGENAEAVLEELSLVANIFAPEEEAEAKRRSQLREEASRPPSVATTVPQLPFKLASGINFKKEEESRVDTGLSSSIRSTGTSAGGGRCGTSPPHGNERKRGRQDDSEASVKTGVVTAGEAVALRKELERLKMQRHDPLRVVKQYENQTVARAARLEEMRGRAVGSEGHSSKTPVATGAQPVAGDNDSILSRVQQLLSTSKGRF